MARSVVAVAIDLTGYVNRKKNMNTDHEFPGGWFGENKSHARLN